MNFNRNYWHVDENKNSQKPVFHHSLDGDHKSMQKSGRFRPARTFFGQNPSFRRSSFHDAVLFLDRFRRILNIQQQKKGFENKKHCRQDQGQFPDLGNPEDWESEMPHNRGYLVGAVEFLTGRQWMCEDQMSLQVRPVLWVQAETGKTAFKAERTATPTQACILFYAETLFSF